MANKSRLQVVGNREATVPDRNKRMTQATGKRASKQEAILRVAAEMFNANGIGMVGF